jgi:thymidylate kinase
MSEKKDMGTFLTTLFERLNGLCEYAVLRNFEGLPERNDSRDIDIVLEERDYKRIKPELLKIVEAEGWKIVTLLESDRLVTWVCGHLDEEGRCDLVQLDFFFHTSVFGVKLLSAAEVLKSREFNGKIYHAGKVCEFLDKYMYDRAVGAAYPAKYAETRKAVNEHPEVLRILKEVFGCATTEECDKMSGKKLLAHALKYNLRKNALGTLGGMIRFEYTRVRNYLRSRTGFSIGFTGPDGSGKTTVIDMMIEQLGDVFRKAHAYYHFRPSLFGNLGEVAHSAGIKKEVDRNFDQPHRGGKTGVLNSLLRLLYYTIDYILGYFLKVKTVTRITRLVIFDRYYTDIICDSRRSRIYLSPKFLYYFGKVFIPSLDYNILLTASTETILKRKNELDKEGIETINSKIDYLADKKGYYKVLNETTPQETVAHILSIVFNEQHCKNLKRLKR